MNPDSTELVLVQQVTRTLEFQGMGLPGRPGHDAPGLWPLPFSRFGELYVAGPTAPFYLEYDGEIMGARATVADPPVGQDLILRLLLNSLPVLTLVVPDGETTSGYLAPSNGIFSAGDDLRVEVLQVGSTSPGTTLGVTPWLKVT